MTSEHRPVGTTPAPVVQPIMLAFVAVSTVTSRRGPFDALPRPSPGWGGVYYWGRRPRRAPASSRFEANQRHKIGITADGFEIVIGLCFGGGPGLAESPREDLSGPPLGWNLHPRTSNRRG